MKNEHVFENTSEGEATPASPIIFATPIPAVPGAAQHAESNGNGTPTLQMTNTASPINNVGAKASPQMTKKKRPWQGVTANFLGAIDAFWKKLHSLARRAGLWLAVIIFDLIALFFIVSGILRNSGLPAQRMVQGAGIVFLATTLLPLAVFFREKIQALRKRAGLWMSAFILGLIALILLSVGLLQQSTVLQTLGGLFAGTALTLAVTILTSQVAVKQQNAKEANIDRKNRLYIPVFNELKSI